METPQPTLTVLYETRIGLQKHQRQFILVDGRVNLRTLHAALGSRIELIDNGVLVPLTYLSPDSWLSDRVFQDGDIIEVVGATTELGLRTCLGILVVLILVPVCYFLASEESQAILDAYGITISSVSGVYEVLSAMGRRAALGL